MKYKLPLSIRQHILEAFQAYMEKHNLSRANIKNMYANTSTTRMLFDLGYVAIPSTEQAAWYKQYGVNDNNLESAYKWAWNQLK